ncbi:MAG: TonB-dependent receptor [bacterium]|nr:TonB-dependent receptor [bacterium]
MSTHAPRPTCFDRPASRWLPALTAFLLAAAGVIGPASAHEGEDGVESMVVFGRADEQLGTARAASEGRIAGADLELRPLARTGELLEVIPGLIATQHSGPGKGNQLFLRGFNLDHGTDFAAHFDGVPVNFRSHGHGQGYLDLNFVIPELIETIDFRKGPYRADVGDFASAGASFLRSRDQLPESIASLTIGEDRWVRGLVAANLEVPTGEALVALEGRTYDDPYRLDADLLHINAFAKWTVPLGDGTLRASLLGYHAEWFSTDQIPRRAVESGDVSRLGFIDPDLGGETTRVSANLEWASEGEDPLRLSTYLIYYRLKLFSNFTYFLEPDGLGDQLAQRDQRIAWGARAERDLSADFLGTTVDFGFGAETRLDHIPEVGLYRSQARQRFQTVREDEVTEVSGSAWAEAVWTPVEWMTWTAGVRGDLFGFDVDTKAGQGAFTNGGGEVDGLVSPKLSLTLRPAEPFEIYLNAGGGFHSNDARGTTIRIDPATPTPEIVSPVDPLARQWGAEAGARWQPDRRFHVTGAFWWLHSESELVFVGDGGFTEPQGGSRRYGVELTAFLRPLHWLAFDGSYAWSNADFRNTRSGMDRIPGAIETVVSAGVTLTNGPWSGSLRVRHFGAYPLNEGNTQRAGGTTLVNLGGHYDWMQLRFSLSVLNLFDSKDSDIEYFFESQLQTEAAPEEDVHFHPVPPRQVRATVTARF